MNDLIADAIACIFIIAIVVSAGYLMISNVDYCKVDSPSGPTIGHVIKIYGC